MEIQTTTEFQVIYPAYVMHKKWNMPDGYNDRLFDLALIDCEKNKITTNDDP